MPKRWVPAISRRYIYAPDGELTEVIDHSVAGGRHMYCPDCERAHFHSLAAISSTRGHIYMCSYCGRQTTDDT